MSPVTSTSSHPRRTKQDRRRSSSTSTPKRKPKRKAPPQPYDENVFPISRLLELLFPKHPLSMLIWLYQNSPPLLLPILMILFVTFNVLPALYYPYTTEYQQLYRYYQNQHIQNQHIQNQHPNLPPNQHQHQHENENNQNENNNNINNNVEYIHTNYSIPMDLHDEFPTTPSHRHCLSPITDAFQPDQYDYYHPHEYTCSNHAWLTIGTTPLHKSYPITPTNPDYFVNVYTGIPQRMDGSDSERAAVKLVLDQMQDYFRYELLSHPGLYAPILDIRHQDPHFPNPKIHKRKPRSMVDNSIIHNSGPWSICQNTNELCAFWTSVGECESNRGFMLSHCSASCRLCALLYMNLNTLT